MTLAKGQKVQYTFYGKPETATIERVANGLVWLDNGRWMHKESVHPVALAKNKPIHYICGSGEHGCLYDNGPYATDSLQSAVDSLAETFKLGRTRKARLFAERHLELNPLRDGAAYCEITECDCDKPWEHNENNGPDEWPDYDPPVRIRCNRCEALMINGVFCHETGCPNTKSRYDADSDTWIKQRKCFDCGCTVDAEDPCCSEQN